MDWSLDPLLLAGGLAAAAVLVLGLAALLVTIRRARKRHEASLAGRFRDTEVLLADRRANFFGRLSGDRLQARGSGILVLTPSGLFFSLLLPRREFLIPLETITGVRTARSFLGRTIGRTLLVVEFTAPDGRPDAAAWATSDTELWKATLDGRR